MKTFVLGTSKWGSKTEPAVAFSLLERWFERGHRHIDCATNYPIDLDPSHFRLSEKILSEFIAAHAISDAKIIMKIGSVDNMRTPVSDLSCETICRFHDEYLNMFGANLHSLMIHWDNRDDKHAIDETIRQLNEFNLRIGLSGITHIAAYSSLFDTDIDIQVKHNVFKRDVDRYDSFKNAKFYAYGINAGGMKTFPGHVSAILNKYNSSKLSISTMNQLGIMLSMFDLRINGIVIGVSNLYQLKDTFNILTQIDQYAKFYDHIVHFLTNQ